jgi:DNA polymerase-3 subunit alpha
VPEPPLLADWSASQRLAGERETLGLFLTGHPIAPFEADLRHFASGRIVEFLGDRPGPVPEGRNPYADTRTVKLAGLILEVRRRGTRVSFMLDDRSGRIEVSMFEEVYQRHRDLVVKDGLVQVEGGLRFDEFSDAWRLSAKQVASLPAVRERLARSLLLTWPATADARLLERLETLLRAQRGGQCEVMLRYRGAGASGTLSCAAEWKVRPSGSLIEQLEELLGPGTVRLRYALAAPAAALAH